MSLRASVMDRCLDLPPLYTLVVLREAGDAFAHACAIAGVKGAGSLVWARRTDLAEFAVVLEPQEPLAHARLALYAGMNALADALATQAPPSRPIAFDWPDTIRVDGVLVGGARLGWPTATHLDETPQWLVFSAMIRTGTRRAEETGLRPLFGGLDELGFEAPDPGDIIASFSRHLMSAFDTWREEGFASLARRWLDRFAPRDNTVQIAEDGDLLNWKNPGGAIPARHSLGAALAAPSWLDPATGTPWL